MKKSFIVYHDWEKILDELDNENAGKLFKIMMKYSVTGKSQEIPQNLKLVFILIKQQFDRNLSKYKELSKVRSKFGRRGGLAKATKSHQKPGLLSKATVKDKVKVKVKDRVKDIKSITPQFLISLKEDEKYRWLDIDDQSERWKDWKTSKGRVFKNNQAAFRNWLRKSLDFLYERYPELKGKKKDQQDVAIKKTNKQLLKLHPELK